MKIRHLVEVGKTNPIRTQSKPISQKAKMFVTTFPAEVYENKSNWAICENKPNQTQPVVSLSNQFQRQKNAALNLFAVGYLRKK